VLWTARNEAAPFSAPARKEIHPPQCFCTSWCDVPWTFCAAWHDVCHMPCVSVPDACSIVPTKCHVVCCTQLNCTLHFVFGLFGSCRSIPRLALLPPPVRPLRAPRAVPQLPQLGGNGIYYPIVFRTLQLHCRFERYHFPLILFELFAFLKQNLPMHSTRDSSSWALCHRTTGAKPWTRTA